MKQARGGIVAGAAPVLPRAETKKAHISVSLDFTGAPERNRTAT